MSEVKYDVRDGNIYKCSENNRDILKRIADQQEETLIGQSEFNSLMEKFEKSQRSMVNTLKTLCSNLESACKEQRKSNEIYNKEIKANNKILKELKTIKPSTEKVTHLATDTVLTDYYLDIVEHNSKFDEVMEALIKEQKESNEIQRKLLKEQTIKHDNKKELNVVLQSFVDEQKYTNRLLERILNEKDLAVTAKVDVDIPSINEELSYTMKSILAEQQAICNLLSSMKNDLVTLGRNQILLHGAQIKNEKPEESKIKDFEVDKVTFKRKALL